ncbi:hypothetical protein BDF22DRAFT_687454 [Syncephalis plumigaleata]|nr:hypothetical protein BDF22DRAFT_687454 [Syncephalis plumigaleata]
MTFTLDVSFFSYSFPPFTFTTATTIFTGTMSELRAQAAAAYRTECEETFREACALGNERVVQQMLRTGGVSVNSQNNVNGWTALHWAAARGHVAIVELLLAYNADPSQQAKDGRQPGDLAKDNAIKALLPIDGNGKSTETSTESAAYNLPFTPHYLEQPDLARVWATPEEFEPSLPRATINNQVATTTVTIDNSSDSNANTIDYHQDKNDQVHLSTSSLRELLVYQDKLDADQLIGALNVAQHATIHEVLEQCQQELDIDTSASAGFQVKRATKLRGNLQMVPINEKQYGKTITETFSTASLNENDPLELVIFYKS